MIDKENKKCRLCDAPLTASNKRRSHALTKASFFDPPTLKPGEHLLLLSPYCPNEVDAGHHTWEYALCADCELKLAKWEQERERFLSSADRPTKTPEEQPCVFAEEFNQEYIVLACLSDLYRCHIFTDSAYSGVNLGEKHSSKIASILNQGKIDNYNSYPIVFRRFNNKNNIADEAFQVPYKVRFENRIVCYEVIAPRGWTWMIKVDSQSSELFEKYALGSSSKIHIFNAGDIQENRNRRIFGGFISAALRGLGK